MERETRERLAQEEEEARRLEEAAKLERERQDEEKALRLKIEQETRERVEREIRDRVARENSKKSQSKEEPETKTSKIALVGSRIPKGSDTRSDNDKVHSDFSAASAMSSNEATTENVEESQLEEMKLHVKKLSFTDDIGVLTSNWGSGGDDFDF